MHLMLFGILWHQCCADHTPVGSARPVNAERSGLDLLGVVRWLECVPGPAGPITPRTRLRPPPDWFAVSPCRRACADPSRDPGRGRSLRAGRVVSRLCSYCGDTRTTPIESSAYRLRVGQAASIHESAGSTIVRSSPPSGTRKSLLTRKEYAPTPEVSFCTSTSPSSRTSRTMTSTGIEPGVKVQRSPTCIADLYPAPAHFTPSPFGQSSLGHTRTRTRPNGRLRPPS
ncbi:hypothetical protein RhoFasB10_03574 [Rhodococcus sp. B10]|nr:hypothetical protein [Rhodococcus sp. B10]